MKKIHFLWIAIVLLGIQGVSGFSVSLVSMSPSGDLKDGTPVTVTFEIPRTGIGVYDQLVLASDLDTPAWDAVVIEQSQQIPVNPSSAHGNKLTLNGALYNYASAIPVKVRVKMTGTVPFNHTPDQRLLDIRQFDADGTEYAYPTGYSLPMTGSPIPAVSETEMLPATTAAENPVSETTAPAALAPVPADSSTVTTAPAPRKTVAVPTAWPGSTPAAAAPAGLPVVFGAVGIAGYCLRQKPGR
jgi:hypothetical protein